MSKKRNADASMADVKTMNNPEDTTSRPVRRRPIDEYVIALIAMLLLVAAVWGVPRPIGDLYVGLAGGRDVFNGKLGQPDDWSFMNNDPNFGTHRVWINQNWGTHVAYYGAWLIGGGDGLLALKAIVLLLTALFITLSARQRDVDYPLAILVAGVVLAAGRSFYDLRPNLSTMMMAPLLLWLLYCSREKIHRIWIAVAVVWLWANVHGGFIFGIGMLVLWALCQMAASLPRNGLAGTFRKYWPLPAATAVAVLLAGFANPFGFENITHPFVIATSDSWQGVHEWMTIFNRAGFGTIWEFLCVIGALSVLALIRLYVMIFSDTHHDEKDLGELFGLVVFQVLLGGVLFFVAGRNDRNAVGHRNVELIQFIQVFSVGIILLAVISGIRLGLAVASSKKRIDFRHLGITIFEATLSVIAIGMAVKSRRFIPLAMIVAAPLLAVQLRWALHYARRILFYVVAAGALVPAVLLLGEDIRFYNPNNPLYPAGTIFERMNFVQTDYPTNMAKFIDDNDISGRVFAEWRWEGYLRWKCPQVTTFIGGRAQQAYDVKTYQLSHDILPNPRGLDILRQYRVNMIAQPIDLRWTTTCGRQQLASPTSTWAIIYCDNVKTSLNLQQPEPRMNVLWVDTADPKMNVLVRQAAAGKLKYPNTAIAALSRAMCMESAPVGGEPEAILYHLQEAARLQPSRFVYQEYYNVLGQLAQCQADSTGYMRVVNAGIRFLQNENKRLSERTGNPYQQLTDLLARATVMEKLIELYHRTGRRIEAEQAIRVRSQIIQQLNMVLDAWP